MAQLTLSRVKFLTVIPLTMLLLLNGRLEMIRESVRKDSSTYLDAAKGKQGRNQDVTTLFKNSSDIHRISPFDLGPIDVAIDNDHLLPAPPVGSCSCWNSSRSCCKRRIHRSHKFGHVLLGEMFGSPNTGALTGIRLMTEEYGAMESYFDRPDYREVWVTRDFFDAIVSGYLYHKSGRECWLGSRGEKWNRGPHGFHGPARRDFVKLEDPWPPWGKRNICQYLSQENERNGLRAYIEYSMGTYYLNHVKIYKAVQLQEHPKQRRTMFVCYEDLSSPKFSAATLEKIMKWFYPGDHSFFNKFIERRAVEREYNGSHATSDDEAVRERLRRVAEQLDMEIFNHTVSKSSALFGCGKASA